MNAATAATARIRYERRPVPAGLDGQRGAEWPVYDVYVQAARGARWNHAGMAAACGDACNRQWMALGDGADAWTSCQRSRAQAVTLMLAGVTFRTEQAALARAAAPAA